ncbi:hypothetical protein J4438_01555 [Candidatus Woesearchaeota archaeon]|nr:hypothetical protein [Candidatus Woesearchaeota archaeon]
MKKGELAWDKLGKWILLLIFLILILIVVFKQKDQIMNAIKSLGIALRFGG